MVAVAAARMWAQGRANNGLCVGGRRDERRDCEPMTTRGKGRRGPGRGLPAMVGRERDRGLYPIKGGARYDAWNSENRAETFRLQLFLPRCR